MKKLKYLRVGFDLKLTFSQIPTFRSSLLKVIDPEWILFHNHTKEGFRYKYPLIQYKTIAGKAALLCLQEGIDEIQKFFQTFDQKIHFNGEKTEIKTTRLFAETYNMAVWDKVFHYRLNHWMALNEENYEAYKALSGELDKIELLERILTGQILAMATGIGWEVDKTIKVRIDDLIREKVVPYKDTKMMAFDVAFRSNAFIPKYMGLGKGSSIGFGITLPNIKQERK